MFWRHNHDNGHMPSASDYATLLAGHESCFVEFRFNSELVCVAVMDILEDALSAVYTYYCPEMDKRSLGTFAILWQIYEAKRRNLGWLYLGYWIAASKKMAYKDRFRPFEQLSDHVWEAVT